MGEFQEAISWLQNGEIQVLFFIVGYQDDVNPLPNFETTRVKSSKFYDYREESIYPVVLLEVRADAEFQNADKIVKEVFLKFRDRPEILICMFDGSYMSSEDLTDCINIEYIFAARTPQVELFGFSDDLRHSKSWKADIVKVQSQIIEEYGVAT